MKYSRLLLALAVAVLAAPPAQAQDFIVPEAPLDSARATVRDAVLVLRDSLQVIYAGGARMQRDFQGASGAALLSRAAAMRDGCAASARTVPGTKAVVVAGPAGAETVRRERAKLLVEMDRLATALAECERTFGGWLEQGDGEAVRGYGNRQAEIVRVSLLAYEERLHLYLGAQGIRIKPIGAGAPLTRS
jgi:hypothetical protein